MIKILFKLKFWECFNVCSFQFSVALCPQRPHRLFVLFIIITDFIIFYYALLYTLLVVSFKVSRSYKAFRSWGLESEVTFTQCIPYKQVHEYYY